MEYFAYRIICKYSGQVRWLADVKTDGVHFAATIVRPRFQILRATNECSLYIQWESLKDILITLAKEVFSLLLMKLVRFLPMLGLYSMS
jgi:hypothetical protein